MRSESWGIIFVGYVCLSILETAAQVWWHRHHNSESAVRRDLKRSATKITLLLVRRFGYFSGDSAKESSTIRRLPQNVPLVD